MQSPPERFVAEIKTNRWHLVLFSEFTASGPIALVWDMTTNLSILNEPVQDLTAGREKCEECVKGLLSETPLIVWARQSWRY
jgi:hypothetical protein